MWFFNKDTAVAQEHLAGARKLIIYHRGIPDYEQANDGPRVVLDDLLNQAWRAQV